MRVVIIGTGNVATILGKRFLAADHEIIQVCGRNALHAEELADILSATSTTDLKQPDLSADIYVMAVSDGAIASVAAELRLDKKLVVHTAGAVSKNILSACSRNYGVLYPLQSLRSELNELPDIPFLVDGNTEDDLALITEFANSISHQVQQAGDEQRLKLHVAAVMVSNFTNHLYALAKAYCLHEKVDFSMLLPLITAVAERLHEYEPVAIQTGPALRNDEATIQKHLELLQDHPSLKIIYTLFTESIRKMYKV
ncbi:DUF2520 domain-containing protein [Niastella caeni]|uniref:DUF2520 domain-containing protein n=1 Tax=Niastella caeni TaxID=2569763 RepID=A0A4S8HDK2_9BACT|nr:Rossmann-like and DUF2520 domain-containing protein [Niastella caeni]THU32411.1 DUF2520 domain-containing protein [Niastella caeni]